MVTWSDVDTNGSTMPEVFFVPIEKLAKMPAVIRFHSLHDDGALTLMIHRIGADSSELLSITFGTFSDCRVTRSDQSAKTERSNQSTKAGRKIGKKSSGICWFLTVGSKHVISMEDRVLEVTSRSRPQCSIVAAKQGWLPSFGYNLISSPFRLTVWLTGSSSRSRTVSGL